MAELLGIRDRLTGSESLSQSGFRTNPEIVEEWTPTAVGATLDAVVALPPELLPLR